MSVEPQTWIVGGTDDSGLGTRCLLALQDRFDLPRTISLDLPRDRTGAAAPACVLAFVTAPQGSNRPVDLLRDEEARAILGRTHAPGLAADGPPRLVALALDRGQSELAVDQAVNLAVTTLIDWGHEIACRPTGCARAGTN